MKKIIIYAISIIFTLSIFFPIKSIQAQEQTDGGEQFKKIEYVLFHLETCPHCRNEIKFLNKRVLPKYGEFINLTMYEVRDEKNADIFRQYGIYHNIEIGSVPMAFIDDEIITGYGTDQTTGEEIITTIERKLMEKGIEISQLSNGVENNKLPQVLIYGGVMALLGTVLFFGKKYSKRKK